MASMRDYFLFIEYNRNIAMNIHMFKLNMHVYT